MAKKPRVYKFPQDKLHIVTENMPLVHKVIKDIFSVYHEWYDDMVQEGAIGLMKAIINHDDSRGAQLSTFAYWCIKNEIQKFVSERTDTIKVPVSVGLAINSWRKLEKKGATSEEFKEVLKHNAISEDMLKAGKIALATVSMDEENEDGLPYRDTLPASDMAAPTIDDMSKEMYSEFHDYLNFNYPDNMLHNRIFIDYTVLISEPESRVTDVYQEVCERYYTTRANIKALLFDYNNILHDWLSKKTGANM